MNFFKKNMTPSFLNKNEHKINDNNIGNIKPSIQGIFCNPKEKIVKSITAFSIFMYLFDFMYAHNDKFLKNLKIPCYISESKHMKLENNALLQLNIMENRDLDFGSSKFKSLFNVIDQCSTSIGKRFLKYSICNPLICTDEINERYGYIDYIINHNLYKNIEDNLVNIYDIERLFRKIVICKLSYLDIINLKKSLIEVSILMDTLKNHELLRSILLNVEQLKLLDQFIDELKNTYDDNVLSNESLSKIENSPFKSGIFKYIDELVHKVANGQKIYDDIAMFFSKLILGAKSNDVCVKTKSDKKAGILFAMSKIRGNILKKELINIKNTLGSKIKITDDVFIEFDNIIFNETAKSTTKVEIKNLTDNKSLLEKLDNNIKLEYNNLIVGFYNKYQSIFCNIVDSIKYLDFYKSGAKNAILYNYTKPIILEGENDEACKSGINCQGLRNPLIERIKENTLFIKHDIDLNSEINTICLFGVNSSGKTTIMRSIGMNLIMAQCGYFVAANLFEYIPYKSLFTRILSIDNPYKSQSSYDVEIYELMQITKYADQNSLILADELCKSTDVTSAISLIGASLKVITSRLSTFILTSHFHELNKIDYIKEIKGYKAYYLSTQIDEENEMLIYDRVLKEYDGSVDFTYGLTIYSFLMKDYSNIVEDAHTIKAQLLKSKNEVLGDKKSRYNSNVFMDECIMCGSKNNLETHHIIEQKEFNKRGFTNDKTTNHIKKNQTANLCKLCDKCHDQLHQQNMEIKPIQTSKGTKMIKTKKGK